MAAGATGDLDQITQDQWMGALREWDAKNERAETEALYEVNYGPAHYVQMYVIRDPSGISLKVAQPDEVDPSIERLPILSCIELTEKCLESYLFVEDYYDIGRIWKEMANRIYDASELLPRINSLIKDAEEMLAILKLSEETTQKDCVRDFERLKTSYVGLSMISTIQATSSSVSSTQVDLEDGDLYGTSSP